MFALWQGLLNKAGAEDVLVMEYGDLESSINSYKKIASRNPDAETGLVNAIKENERAAPSAEVKPMITVEGKFYRKDTQVVRY